MGEFDGWMSPKADIIVAQLQQLADARQGLLEYVSRACKHIILPDFYSLA
jgi:hypothetical protein